MNREKQMTLILIETAAHDLITALDAAPSYGGLVDLDPAYPQIQTLRDLLARLSPALKT